jgi:hypothetical protein
MSKKQSVPVSLRALMQRVNRALANQDETLKTSRGERCRQQMGDYYIVNTSRNFIVDKNVDPEELGRELGVLKAWESVIIGENR